MATRTGQQIQKLNFYNVYNVPHDFTLYWTESEPTDTTVTVEISFDQGDSWTSVQNSIAETGTIQNVNTDGYTDLYVRITLEAVDTSNNPTLEDLYMIVELAGTEPFSTDAVSILPASGDRIDCLLWYERDMPETLTMMFKAKIAWSGSDQIFFDWIYYDGSSYDSGERLALRYDESDDHIDIIIAGTSYTVLDSPDTEWHNYAIRVESDHVYVFIDGEQELEQAWSGMSDQPNRLFIGHNYQFSNLLNGSVTDWLIDENLQNDAAIKFHHMIDMPWYDPTDIRNQRNNVVINKSGIRMNKAEYAQVDKKDRTIDIGSAGILVRDKNGTIIHDILNEPLTENYYMGHLYWLDESVDGEIVSSVAPTPDTWYEAICVTLNNDNARGGLFKCQFSGIDESNALTYIGGAMILRPKGTNWSASNDSVTPSGRITIQGGDAQEAGCQLLIPCPIGDDNKIEWRITVENSIIGISIYQVGIYL